MKYQQLEVTFDLNHDAGYTAFALQTTAGLYCIGWPSDDTITAKYHPDQMTEEQARALIMKVADANRDDTASLGTVRILEEFGYGSPEFKAFAKLMMQRHPEGDRRKAAGFNRLLAWRYPVKSSPGTF